MYPFENYITEITKKRSTSYVKIYNFDYFICVIQYTYNTKENKWKYVPT